MDRGHVNSLARLSLALAVTLLLASGARAQSTDYSALIQEGLSEFELGHWTEAYTLFKRAHEGSPNARTLRGMGMASYELQEYARALVQLRASLDSKDKPLRTKMRQQVKELADRAARLVGTLEVTLVPAEGKLFVNDRLTAERTVLVPVGETVVRAELAGYEPSRRVIMVDGGNSYPVELNLTLARSAPAAAVGGGATQPAGADADRVRSDASTEGSVLSSPWLWVSVGAAVVAGVLAATIATTSGGDVQGSQTESNVGISINALGAR